MASTPPRRASAESAEEARSGSISRRTFLRRSGGLAAASLLPGAAFSGLARAAGAPKTITMGVFPQPGNLDPGGEGITIDAFITDQITEPLVYRFAGSSKFWPGLATSWKVSNNAKTYTFNLRKGVHFHDGTPFNADAVKATFDHIVAPATKAKAPLAALGPYAGTRVLSQYVAEVNFDKPNAGFLETCTYAGGGISSPKALKAGPAAYGEHPVGTGPFMFKNWSNKQEIQLVRNPNYHWAPSFFKRNGPAPVQQLNFLVLLDASARANALRTGEIDIALSLNPQDVTALTGSGFTQVNANATGIVAGIPITVTKAPTDDVRVRQALIYAADQQAIVQTLFQNLYTPAYQIFCEGTQGYESLLNSMYSYNLDKAGKLLDAAGWKMGSGGKRQKNGKNLTLTMINLVGFGFDGIAQLLQSQWSKIGITTTLSDQAFPGVITSLNNGAGNVSNYFYYDISAADALNASFGSAQIKSGYNWSHYANPKVDSLVSQYNSTVKPAAQNHLMAQANEILMKNAVYIPIYNLRYGYTTAKGVSGLTFNPAGYPYFYGVA